MSVNAESVDHVMSTQDTWEAQVASNNGSGDFYVEVEGKKVNVYFDELDAAWKVDSTAFGVANNVAVQASMDYSDIEARIEAASGTTVDLSSLSDQDIFLNATETDIISLLQDNDLEDVEWCRTQHSFTTVSGVNVAVDFDGMGWTLSNSKSPFQQLTIHFLQMVGLGLVASVLTSSKWAAALPWVMLARIPTLWVTAPRASLTSLVT